MTPPRFPPILIATQCFPPDVGGIETLMGNLATALAVRGHEVLVLADGRGEHHHTGGQWQVEVRRFTGPRILRRRMKSVTANRLIAERHFAGLICDSWKSLELLRPVGIPVSVLAHGMEYPPETTSGKRSRIAASLSKARTVVASSSYAAQLVSPYVTSVTVVQVTNPPILPQPEPDAGAVSEFRAMIGHRGPIVAGLGRLEPRKGFDQVIAALAQIQAQFPTVVFALAGSGEDRPRLEALAAQTGTSDSVRLLGRIAPGMKAALLSEADVFAMPVRREGASVEGFGIVYTEAAWYGLPAIAGSEGGAVDAVIDGETGLIVDGTDTAAIADALRQILSDQRLRDRLGRAARDRARTSGLWEHRVDDYVAALGL